MKKNGLLIIFVLLTINLLGQISEGDVIISLDGNYMKTNSENGVTTNMTGTEGQYLNVGSSIGYFLTDRLVVGIGLDYNWGNETRFNKFYFNNFLQQEEMDIKSKVFLPNIYLGLYFPIISKLYFNTNLKFSYGIIKSNYTTIYMGAGPLIISDTVNTNNTPYVRGSGNESKTDYFSTQVCPELTYFITTKFSAFLGLGGIEYSLLDWKRKNSNWTVNFNPIYWRLGMKFKI